MVSLRLTIVILQESQTPTITYGFGSYKNRFSKKCWVTNSATFDECCFAI